VWIHYFVNLIPSVVQFSLINQLLHLFIIAKDKLSVLLPGFR